MDIYWIATITAYRTVTLLLLTTYKPPGNATVVRSSAIPAMVLALTTASPAGRCFNYSLEAASPPVHSDTMPLLHTSAKLALLPASPASEPAPTALFATSIFTFRSLTQLAPVSLHAMSAFISTLQVSAAWSVILLALLVLVSAHSALVAQLDSSCTIIDVLHHVRRELLLVLPTRCIAAQLARQIAPIVPSTHPRQESLALFAQMATIWSVETAAKLVQLEPMLLQAHSLVSLVTFMDVKLARSIRV